MNKIIIENGGDFSEFEYPDGLLNVSKILSFSDEIEGTGVLLKDFSWSDNKKSWSSWVPLTSENLQNIVPIIGNHVYLKFKYTLSNGDPVSIIDITVNYTTTIDSGPNVVPDTYSSGGNLCCVNTGSVRGVIVNTDASCSTFNPYAVNPAVDMFQDIMVAVNNQFGIPVQYFRAVPDKRSEDVIFMEQSLFGVEDCKDVKIMIPDNEFPDSMPTYNQWGIDFEHPFEVHIVKDYFQNVYGKAVAPQKRDIIFIPIMNRIFDVVSSYMFKDFMQRDAYWKVSLRKHQEKSNVYKSETAEALINELTQSTEDIIGKEMTEDLADITNNQQIARTIGMGIGDPTRDSKNETLVISNENLMSNATIIAESKYEHYRNAGLSENVKNVIYKNTVLFAENEEQSFTTWIKHHDLPFSLPEDRVTVMSISANNELTFKLSNTRIYTPGTEIMLKRSTKTIYGTILNVVGGEYTMSIEDHVLNEIDQTDPTWSSRIDWYCTLNDTKVLLNGLENNKGMRISLVAKRFFKFNFNDSVYYSISPEVIEDKWYGVVCNMSKKYRQLKVDVWSTDDTNGSSELKHESSSTVPNFENVDTSNTDVKYSLFSGPMYQTNIRLFNEIIPEDDQSLVLTQNIIKDASKAIIIDNALNDINLPFFGSAK